ncbi:MAG: hypothetical protein B6U78_00750 [Candidatus Aenigmarchaeota archaeon ex4484_224]|nr:MAG: hypothetical protein B6U78_00750 [Candidatus Aenigmarchaeota archaeon ex4484_224]
MIRGIAKIVFSSLFIILLSIWLTLYLIENFTTYQNFQKIINIGVQKIASSQFGNLTKEERINLINQYCSFSSYLEIPKNEPLIEKNINISCSELKNKDPLEVISQKISSEIYYKQYNCNFVDCLEENPFYVFSESANSSFNFFEKISLILTILFGILTLVAYKSWDGRLKFFGISFLIVGIYSFLLLNYSDSLTNILLQKFSQIQVEGMDQIVNLIVQLFVSPLELIYKVTLLLGVFLLGLGYFLNYLTFIRAKRKKKK